MAALIFHELEHQQMRYVIHVCILRDIAAQPDLLNLRELRAFPILHITLMMNLKPCLIKTASALWWPSMW